MNRALDIIDNMEKIIIGKREVIENIVIALLAEGHILIEDVPGVGKTRCAEALAKSINGTFNRIQFTPDVMASDITGFTMYNNKTNDFEYKKGVAFCNFLLGDEINRASPKTQSSLLEVMEEKQVTVDGITRKVPKIFMVIATENPIESSGTNKLPEAQMDRFMFKLSIGYPTKKQEKEMLKKYAFKNPLEYIKPVVSVDDVIKMQEEVNNINVSDSIEDLIISIVSKTRESDKIELGVSPRGSICLYRAAKAKAYISGRDFVLPEDIISIANEVLGHRIILSSEAISDGFTVKYLFKDILNSSLHENSKVLS